MTKDDIIQISLNSSGAYITYLVKNAPRGMHGKTKGHVDEVLIVGVPNRQLEKFCEQEGIYITNLYCRDSFTDKILLVRENEEAFNYVKKNTI